MSNTPHSAWWVTLFLLLLAGPRANATEPLSVGTGVHLIAAGDLLIHAAVKRAARQAAAYDSDLTHAGWTARFRGIRDTIARADVAFVNLEVPIAPEVGRPLHGEVFNAPSALAPALAEVGFDVISIANNHVFDQGPAGLLETLRHTEGAGLVAVGAGPTCAAAVAPRVIETAGHRVAFLAVSDLSNIDDRAGETAPCAAFSGPVCAADCGPDRDAIHFAIDLPPLLNRIREARTRADTVVVSFHWQVEYITTPLSVYRPIAQSLVDAGADVVLGHHPHVLQPVERLTAADGRPTVVAWSLGNLISDMGRTFDPATSAVQKGDTRDGVLLDIELMPGAGVGAVRAIPTWTRNNHLSRGSGQTQLEVVTHAYAETFPWPGERELLRARHARITDVIGDHSVVEDSPAAQAP
jgi:poly-gamma-glutamate synthesis protein (capsule biosynthesis protein)